MTRTRSHWCSWRCADLGTGAPVALVGGLPGDAERGRDQGPGAAGLPCTVYAVDRQGVQGGTCLADSLERLKREALGQPQQGLAERVLTEVVPEHLGQELHAVGDLVLGLGGRQLVQHAQLRGWLGTKGAVEGELLDSAAAC